VRGQLRKELPYREHRCRHQNYIGIGGSGERRRRRLHGAQLKREPPCLLPPCVTDDVVPRGAKRERDRPADQAQTDDRDPGDGCLPLRGKVDRQTGLLPGLDTAFHVVELGQPDRGGHLTCDGAALAHLAHEQHAVPF
jgi:hypothetical protein